ncbi:hypothetical protein ACFOG5_21010 [Pedobacter fastidiosus]|uniref:hypothetical protein n=1 Tax=Pedobacter fastidiosus TaxID=2765361 RepID=UPI00360A13DB
MLSCSTLDSDHKSTLHENDVMTMQSLRQLVEIPNTNGRHSQLDPIAIGWES